MGSGLPSGCHAYHTDEARTSACLFICPRIQVQLWVALSSLLPLLPTEEWQVRSVVGEQVVLVRTETSSP